MSKPDKLVAMGNQVAAFFRSQPGDQAEAVANHLTRFWTPGMCACLAAHVRGGGEAAPLVKEAVKRLPNHTPL